jgi:hypothetical protein
VRRLDAVVPIPYTFIGIEGIFQLHFSNGPGELSSVCGVRFNSESIQYDHDCTFWIRGSTGRLCTDLIPPDLAEIHVGCYERTTRGVWEGLFSLNVPHMETMVTDSLTLGQFHAICADLPRWWVRGFPTPVTVHLGAVVASSDSHSPYLDEIVSLSNITINSPCWKTVHRLAPRAQGEVTEDGWTRYSYFSWPVWRSP